MNKLKRVGTASRALWLLLGVLLVAGTVIGQSPGVIPLDTISKGLDLAAHKDITWLAMAVALAAIGVIFWLIKIIVGLNTSSIKAINDLCAELKNRPCFREWPHNQHQDKP